MGAMMMADALKAYAGKRIFITGHTGFKGSWLAHILSELGGEITGYALPPVDSDSHFEMLGLRESINHIEGDIRDYENLKQCIQAQSPDYVFHLAAQALVKASYINPVDTFNTNVMGGVNLLEAIRFTPSVRSLVFITSDKCYENHEWVWGYRESDGLGGHDPYSASKAAAELVFSAYWRSYLKQIEGLGAATARAGNVIGGGDWSADRIIPDCMRAIRMGVPISIRSPNATRPWQHVLEPLAGYLLLGANLYENPEVYSGSWNFGPDSSQAKNVGWVANRIVDLMACGDVSFPAKESQQHEANLLQLNCDKANHLLGWFPRWDVEITLYKTAEWYKKVIDGEPPKTITNKQIHEYFHEMNQG